MSFKGDWKYMVQLFNMTNTPSKEQVPGLSGYVNIHRMLRMAMTDWRAKNV